MENSYRVRKYSQEAAPWNDFIQSAKNATFLFNRGFMDYHDDRFTDHSLIVENQSGKIVAVLPAHVNGAVVTSHAGLTYGGLVLPERIKMAQVIHIFSAILKYLKGLGIATLSLKMLPSIYAVMPADELQYALFLTDARLVRRDSLSVLDLSQKQRFSKDRIKCVARGVKSGLTILEDGNLDLFWNTILIPNMRTKRNVAPVHSLPEIELLMQRFPENIRHFNVYHKSKIVAGTTVFVTPMVAHPQYISANDEKNSLGSLDFLYHELITNTFAGKKFFDFGISNRNNGRQLDQNLAFWKESFGTGVVTQDFYEVATDNFKLLENVLI